VLQNHKTPFIGEHALLDAACPSCPIGQQARAEFCALSPGLYSSLIGLPFVIVLLAALLLGGRALKLPSTGWLRLKGASKQ
jgi:hypothetical protein